jgi:drug/metabolite transporter (DMT)-like permease
LSISPGQEAAQTGADQLTTTAALIGATIISFSAIFFALSGADPLTGAFYRVGYAIPILFVIWWVRRHLDHRSARSRWLALAAGVALGLDMWSWHTSIGYIGAGLATLIANVQVVLVAIAAWLFFGERPPRVTVYAIPVILVGVALVSGLGQDNAFGSNPLRGTFLALLAAVFYAIFLLTMKFTNTVQAPAAGPLLEVSFGGLVTISIIGLLRPGIDFGFDWPSSGWLLVLALGPQVVAWLLIGYALPRLPAAETATIVLLQPALTMIWAAMIFDERPSSLQIAGAVTVMVGVGVVAISSARSGRQARISAAV